MVCRQTGSGRLLVTYGSREAVIYLSWCQDFAGDLAVRHFEEVVLSFCGGLSLQQ